MTRIRIYVIGTIIGSSTSIIPSIFFCLGYRTTPVVIILLFIKTAITAILKIISVINLLLRRSPPKILRPPISIGARACIRVIPEKKCPSSVISAKRNRRGLIINFYYFFLAAPARFFFLCRPICR